jgi:hypothetical protein
MLLPGKKLVFALARDPLRRLKSSYALGLDWSTSHGLLMRLSGNLYNLDTRKYLKLAANETD